MMQGNMIKAAFFDIDGTLAAVKSHIIPDSTREALRRLREKGISCILSTGQHPLEVAGYVTDRIEEDGIWKALVRLEIIQYTRKTAPSVHRQGNSFGEVEW